MNLNLISVEPENLAAFILTNEFVLKREREEINCRLDGKSFKFRRDGAAFV